MWSIGDFLLLNMMVAPMQNMNAGAAAGPPRKKITSFRAVPKSSGLKLNSKMWTVIMNTIARNFIASSSVMRRFDWVSSMGCLSTNGYKEQLLITLFKHR